MRALILAGLLCLAVAPCRANDTTAELKTGGLVFTTTPDIEMRSEDLFVSTASIVVRYRFFNHGKVDVSTLVAFPMPDIRDPGDGEDVAIPVSKDNFLDFQTTVDGLPVNASLEQHALSQGVDRTAVLKGLGVPLLPYAKATNDALDRVPREKWPALVESGLAAIEDATSDKPHLRGRWTLKSAYTWQQTFPAGRELAVEHHYKPSVGGAAATSLGVPGIDVSDVVRTYCVDADVIASVGKAEKAPGSTTPPFAEQHIAYILTTGANWAAPIEDFRLLVDKGDARNLVSFCGDGIRKISPTQFEMRKKQFLPRSDLDVLILIPTSN